LRVRYLADPKYFKLFVGLVLLYILIRLLKDIFKYSTDESKNKSIGSIEFERTSFSSIKFGFNDKIYQISTFMTLMLSFAVGIVGGAYGIGGGAIVAPFLVAVARFPIYAIAGVSLLSTLVASGAGIIIYIYILPLLSSEFIPISPDWLLGLFMGIGGFIGIYLGARSQRYMSARFINIILALSLGFVVVKYIGGYLFSL